MPESELQLVGEEKSDSKYKKSVVPDWAAVPVKKGHQCLVVRKNEENIDVVTLADRSHTIFGRKKKRGCHVVLEHSSISRRHAMIVCDGRRFFLADLESAHGTKINDRKIEAGELIELQENSVITFGHSTRSYVFKENDDDNDSFNNETKNELDDMAKFSLPTSFGGGQGNNKRVVEEKSSTLFDSFVRKETTREQREKEIEAATRSFLSSSSSNKASSSSSSHVTNTSTKRKNSSMKSSNITSYRLPVTHEVDITEVSHHKKTVSCIAIDRAGARMSTGSFDYDVKMWDFHGMKDKRRPFREFEVIEGHPVMSLSYSPTGDRLLIGTGESRCKIVDRDGSEILTFRKGDPYLHDMSRTAGHITGVTSCYWLPGSENRVVTSSRDSTVRIWDLNGKKHWSGELVNLQIIKHKDASGRRTGVTCVTCSNRLIASGCEDGSVQLWTRDQSKYTRPQLMVRDAHEAVQNGICSMAFDPDGRMIATRGHDKRLRLWDTRKFSEPVQSVAGLFTSSSGGAGVAFDKDGMILATVTASGTTPRGKKIGGKVLFFDIQRENPAPIHKLNLGKTESGVALCWHHTMNQIAIGTSTGRVKMLFSPEYSVKGAVMMTSRPLPKKRKLDSAAIDEILAGGTIVNPNALPEYSNMPSQVSKQTLARRDPKKSKKPYAPQREAKFDRYMKKNHNDIMAIQKERRAAKYLDNDPRAELLKYADKTDGGVFTNAWAKTQPKTVLASKTLEQEAIDLRKADEDYLKNNN